jgi:DNA-binding NtrC family response regulator
MTQSILIVDDEPAIHFSLSRYFGTEGYVVKTASTLAEARETVASQRFDAILLDHNLPDGSGVDWVGDLRETCPDAAIIVITGVGDIPLAVEAMRRGADNFLTKPISLDDLHIFLKKSLELGSLRRKVAIQQRLTKAASTYFGDSAGMKRALELASTAAEHDATVLLQGESGTGKGVLAHWIHEHGLRRYGPFVEINCSGLRGDLLASELFGHTRGAFTSAVQDRQGLIEIADNGTLFLDEIGDMDLAVQAQFLKVIEEKTFRRLGESKVRKSDFRLMCATNKDLSEETRQGRFRQDLYFRIHVFPITLPPLRERPEDIPGLVRHFLVEAGLTNTDVSPEVMALQTAYRWPGNVRELKNVLERSLLLARKDPLGPKHFPGLDFSGAKPTDPDRHESSLDRLEKDYLEAVVKKAEGDMETAAQELGISRATLYRKLKKLRKSS